MKTILVFCPLLISCAHSNQVKFEQALKGGNCEDALMTAPENQDSYKVINTTKQGVGKVVSYSLTGAAYSAQVLWDISAGIVTTVTIIPLIPLMYLPEKSLSKDKFNLPVPVEKLFAPKLGSDTYRNTEYLRCPNVKDLSQTVRRIARCYYDKGGNENTERAIKTLKSVMDSGQFCSCLPEDELNAYTSELKNYQEQFDET
jgi:hypothetical protein